MGWCRHPHLPGLTECSQCSHCRVGRKLRIVPAALEAAQPLYLFCRSLTRGDVGTCANPVDTAESADSQVVELRERLEMDLVLLGEEHHEGIRRKKQQHATEVRATVAADDVA